MISPGEPGVPENTLPVSPELVPPVRPAAVCLSSVSSVLCLWSGFLGLFFLLPLGLGAFLYGRKTGWLASVSAALINVLVTAVLSVLQAIPLYFAVWNGLYFSILAFLFMWIILPASRPERAVLRNEYRLAAGSLAAFLTLIPFFIVITRPGEIRDMFLSSLNSVGAFSGLSFDAGEALASLAYVGQRGGILVSLLLFFAVSRQLASFIASVVRRRQLQPGLINFHTGSFLIWFFSVSLGMVLLGKILPVEFLEIAGWNILLLCGMLYLAQGGGIALFYLVRLPPLLRILINVMVILLLFRPRVNLVVLGVLVLLGIIENWVPLRAPDIKGSPPTPEA